MSLLGRTTGIQLYGPPELKNILDVVFNASQTKFEFPFEFFPLENTNKQIIYEDAGLRIFAFPLKHRIKTFGFSIEEIHQKFPLNKEKVEKEGLTNEQRRLLSEGRDFERLDGSWVRYIDFTLAKPTPRIYSYCSDTMPFGKLSEYLEGTTTLYHEATFLKDRKERANETFHSTAEDAGNQAFRTQVNKLLLGHFSSRYTSLEPLEEEAKMVFPSVTAVKDGDCIEIV